MKITKDPRNLSKNELQEINAKIGCDVCPICKEKRSFQPFGKGDKPHGILNICSRSELTGNGIFRSKYKTVSMYKCFTCSATWDSDPY